VEGPSEQKADEVKVKSRKLMLLEMICVLLYPVLIDIFSVEMTGDMLGDLSVCRGRQTQTAAVFSTFHGHRYAVNWISDKK
jgi:hypothetical protein